jgi:thiosulfate/3-mercaptopyruvate sulfurtransferase
MVKKIFYSMVVVFLFMTPLKVAYGAWANPDLLYQVDQAEKIIGNTQWLILDCRDQASYEKGHLPGAIHLGRSSAKKILRDGTARTFQDFSIYEKLLGGAGISNDKDILVYSDVKSKIMDDAFLAFWVLEYLGHTKVHLLNGGFDAWVQTGKKVETVPVKGTPATFKVKADLNKLATSEELSKLAKNEAKDIQLVDNRAKEEFEGYDIRSIRGGHVPNTAKNVAHVAFFEQKKDEKTGKTSPTGVLSEAAVGKALEGLDKNKRTIFLCQTGTRSSFGYFVARLNGFKNTANHDDGWVVWGSNFSKNYPVEKEQWLDFSRIEELEKKVKNLEEKIKDLERKN